MSKLPIGTRVRVITHRFGMDQYDQVGTVSSQYQDHLGALYDITVRLDIGGHKLYKLEDVKLEIETRSYKVDQEPLDDEEVI